MPQKSKLIPIKKETTPKLCRKISEIAFDRDPKYSVKSNLSEFIKKLGFSGEYLVKENKSP